MPWGARETLCRFSFYYSITCMFLPDTPQHVSVGRHLRTSLCKNQTSWEMKTFNPPFKFCKQLGTQGECTKMPFLKVAALLLSW